VADLSVLIAARNEEWLPRTIQDVLDHSKADTEIIVVLDGAWPSEPLPQHPRVHVVFESTSIGQRAAINLAASLSRAEYVAKLDAHCSVADGWDVELIRAAKALGQQVVQIPTQHNLHVFDWICVACGRRTYQGPTPTICQARDVRDASDRGQGCGTAGPFRRDVVWDAIRRRTESWCFDHTLHFQYDGRIQLRADAEAKKRGQPPPEVIDTMSCLGACWFLSREYFWELGGLDTNHGSWGQMGTELSCKVWLSGGRMVTNRRTWFSHLFRTQGGDFGFPYPHAEGAQERARAYSRSLWLENAWPQQIHPLRWLVEKFYPVKGWTKEQVNALPATLPTNISSADTLASRAKAVAARDRPSVQAVALESSESPLLHERSMGRNDASHDTVGDRAGVLDRPAVSRARPDSLTKGLVYYSDCKPEPLILDAVRAQLQAVTPGPIAAVTLAPADFGDVRIVLPLERSYLAMFKQILAGLEALDTEYAFLVEHDVLYSADHFAFTPPRDDTFYYNQHVYKVDVEDGKALHYLCSQTSGLCANRQLLIEHYRARVARVERDGYSRTIGFEPGTRQIRHGGIDDRPAATWLSAVPNIDLRHGHNLTPSRWKKEQFKNQKYTAGWTEGHGIPGWTGWEDTRGRVRDLLRAIAQPASQSAPQVDVEAPGLAPGVLVADGTDRTADGVDLQDDMVPMTAVGGHV
jgi:hypothetical protein